MMIEELRTELESQGKTLAFAESCTAGLAMSMFTETAGASNVFRGGIVVYSDELKASLLKVDVDVLNKEGAVSEQVVTSMARSVRELTGSDLGVAVSGIAGPGGGSDDKPVGLVFVAATDGTHTVCERLCIDGDRGEVRRAATEKAMDLALEALKLE